MRSRVTRSTKTRELEVRGYICVPHRQTTHASHKRIIMHQAIMQIIGILLISTHKLDRNNINKIGI